VVRLRLSQGFQLRALIDYVSEKTGTAFVFDDEVGDRVLNLRAPDAIPVDSLYDLLGSVLRMQNLAIVEMEAVGWKRIVPATEMAQLTPGVSARDGGGAAEIRTQVFELVHVAPDQVAQMLRPFLTQPGGNAVGLADSRVLVVTDYAHVVDRAAGLIRVLDESSGKTKTEFYVVQEGHPEDLAERVEEVFGGPKEGIALLGDARTRTVVVVGDQAKVQAAITLLEQMDRPDASSFQIYRLVHIDAQRATTLIANALGFPDGAAIGITPDPESNTLIVRGSPKRHQQVAEVIGRVDVPVERVSNPIRFYKLQHADALEVFFSLQALQEVSAVELQLGLGVQPAAFGMATGPLGQPLAGNSYFNPLQPANRSGAYAGGYQAPYPNAYSGGYPGMGTNQGYNPTMTMPPGLAQSRDLNGRPDPNAQRISRIAALGQTQTRAATLPGGARLAVDIGTNSLIIHAPPETQEIYSQLIDSLDVQRPQVMIRATIVAVDTSNNFRLGVEVSAGDRIGGRRNFQFSQFGLSEVDPVSGALAVTPALGFHGVVVDPNVADVVVQALTSDSRSRVLATPKVLVNDNSTGQLESIASIPFNSVNASDTVATTSVGGSQDAGTIITVTPQINEGGYMKLDFGIEFSTFVGQSVTDAGGNVIAPPPRQIDRINSSITIPDGHTVIVGGLSRENEVDSYSGIPGLAKIPILRSLTGLTSHQCTNTTFFLFLTPTVLRDGAVFQQECPPGNCRECPASVYYPDLPPTAPRRPSSPNPMPTYPSGPDTGPFPAPEPGLLPPPAAIRSSLGMSGSAYPAGNAPRTASPPQGRY
jgi:type II secretory pathway component GspD/PulD (secretin)